MSAPPILSVTRASQPNASDLAQYALKENQGMPYKVEWYPMRVHREFLGNVTGWDLLRSSLDIYADERFDHIHSQIIDFSTSKKLQFAKIDLRKVDQVEKLAQKSNPKLHALIILPEYIFDAHIWFVEEYGKETDWRIRRFACTADAIRSNNLGCRMDPLTNR